ncbi:MAG: hypothetical protein KBG15_24505 [Kofleriaceae bacterium]|nr:hypothetical protein [Kofleriaceae bacterium]
MTIHRFGAWVLAALLCSTTALAAVQAQPSPALRVDAALLTRRISEQLATEGTVLSRLGLTVQVEAIGDKFLLSLLDTVTGQVVASSKAENLPADPEAAVATVTHIVADMVARTRTPATAIATASNEAVTLEEGKRIRAFREKQIGMTPTPVIFSSVLGVFSPTIWIPTTGSFKAPMSLDAFYRLVGRPDYAARYHARRKKGQILVIASTLLGSAGILYGSVRTLENQSGGGSISLMSAGCLVLGVTLGSYLISTAGESAETHIALAEAYNQRLRTELRIPDSVSARQRTKPTYSNRVAITPLAGPSGGGLSLAGSF